MLKQRLMNKQLASLLLAPAVVVGLSSALIQPAHALDRGEGKNILKQSLFGAGAGAILGGVSDDGSALKGAGYGALSGAGTGLIDSSDTMNRNPALKSTAKGAVVGTGVSGATNNSKVKGAAVGAGAGLGWHFLKKWMD